MESEILGELLLVEQQLQEVQDQIKFLLDQQEKLYEKQSDLNILLEECKAHGSSNATVPISNEDWSGIFQWDGRAEDIRFNIFGISSYRANQREIINAVMSRRDILVIMAAGGGKSLCYQLPAVLCDGVALVVSPLLSLIQDQVMGLTALGIPTNMLTSTTSKEDEKLIYRALEKGEGELKILYVTPEKISKSKRFMSKLEKCHHAGRLSLISVDEAHCCSQWGHDFRPDYKNLAILKTQFPDVPMLALTATATRKVQADLTEMLRIPNCVKFVSTVNRPNLFYKVKAKSSVGKMVIDDIAHFIKQSYPNNESGIIYCFSRKESEQVAKDLRQMGVAADYYHADMDAHARERVHMLWSSNKIQVIVGTVAFGMGINKPDVRFVIHHSLSKSMEAYYQESGRAGRDGLPADCLLLYRPGDVPRQSSMVFYENSGLQNLYDMVRYCQSNKGCRRDAFFHHFGEPMQDCNGMCDTCAHAAEIKEIDATSCVRVLMLLLQEMHENDQRITMLQLADKLKLKLRESGNATDHVSELKREEMEQLIVQLLLDRVLKEEFQHTAYATNAYVTMGPLWRQALYGKKAVKLAICTGDRDSSSKTSAAKHTALEGLELALDKLRRDLASSHGGIFPHAVLSMQHIGMLNAHRPKSFEQLEKLIGRSKAEKYGDKILILIQQHVTSDQPDGNSNVEPEENGERRKKRLKTQRTVVHVQSSDNDI